MNIIYYTYIVRVFFLDKNEIDEGVARTGPECHYVIQTIILLFFFFVNQSRTHSRREHLYTPLI